MKLLTKLMLLVMVISVFTMSVTAFASEPDEPIIVKKPPVVVICSEPDEP